MRPEVAAPKTTLFLVLTYPSDFFAFLAYRQVQQAFLSKLPFSVGMLLCSLDIQQKRL